MNGTSAPKIMFLRGFTLATTLLLAACGSSNNDSPTEDIATPSVAREWNEVLLEGIRGDFARPTVHARNLYHVSAAMYDAWAAYSDEAKPYLLGSSKGGYDCNLDDFPAPKDVHLAREEAISHAAYQLIRYRFRLSPGVLDTEDNADALLAELGFDPANDSTDYQDGSPAALGNYIAKCYIEYGWQDGSNELGFFENLYYSPVNPDIRPNLPGNPNIVDLNRWQPIALPTFIDQSGNLIDTKIEFLSPEWGAVAPFALTDANKNSYQRDGFTYDVYYDPGMPPSYLTELYKWAFSLVAVWSSHLDPNFTHPDPQRRSGSTMIDISPASLGNPANADPNNYYPPDFNFPASLQEYQSFYDLLDGGDPSTGYDANPVTGAPYEPQMVPLGDYARVLAEFWADGPDSETPPGHWFTILNEVNDHPLLERRFEGVGTELGPLEWDIKAYFALGGAMHDAAIASWGVKGWYDYLRPLSAIRAMADISIGGGQSSDPNLPSYSVNGIPLYDGFIELIEAGDPLAGNNNQHVGKIKLLAWKGPDYIADPSVDEAGVGWIRADNWWPYQRPTFVSPPFAGYVSGHSTYSRAAAEVLTALTGTPFFPGGKSGFEAPKNEFLVFEEGPSVDIVLEWATYRDASDQCSLSRIWGGIHPPVDDIPGRLMGAKIGPAAFQYAKDYFEGTP